MNNDHIRSSYDKFILNDKQCRTSQNKVYTIKFVSLLLTMIIIPCTQQYEKEKLGEIKQSSYVPYLSYIIAFGVSCFSTFIGHRKLYFISYSSLIAFFVLVYYPNLFGQYEIIKILLLTLRNILFIQTKIQIYGAWPQQFGRIFVEFYAYSRIVSFAFGYIHYQDIFLYVVVGVNFVLIYLRVNNFISPATDSVFKDFIRLLANLKPLIFTILIGLSDFLSKLLKNLITQEIKSIDKYGIFELISTIIIIISYVIFQTKQKNFGYQPTFIIFASLILLLLVSFIMETFILIKQFLFSIDLILYLFIIVIIVAQIMYSIPQYQQILLNLGIRNIDFASSYQSLVFGVIYLINDPILKQNQYISKNLSIIIPSICGIIFVFSVIFYQFLGFKKYFRKSNRSIIEELTFSIEVI